MASPIFLPLQKCATCPRKGGPHSRSASSADHPATGPYSLRTYPSLMVDFNKWLAQRGVPCAFGTCRHVAAYHPLVGSGDPAMARILIGTSGWHYDSWRGPFFPKGLPLKSQLQYYASQFPTTELNGVFYRTPTPEAVKSWRQQTGNDFVFAWKASKFITHWKRLSEKSVNSLELLEDRLSLLGNKAGPILFQLPPIFRADAERLES